MIYQLMSLIELNKANFNKMKKKRILNNYNHNNKCHKKQKMKVFFK